MIDEINKIIQQNENTIDTDQISDGWHTFGDLYFHRSILFMKLCKLLSQDDTYLVYRSQKHYDGMVMKGFFCLGVILPDKTYISYHMDMKYWQACSFAQIYDTSPIQEKYTSEDAIRNLQKI